MTKKGLDGVDRALIAVLQENARLSTAELARRLNVARTTVQDRINRLEDDGVLLGYTARVAFAPQAPLIRAHIALTVDPQQVEACVEALKHIAEVRTVFGTAGPYQLLAVVGASSTERLDAVIDAAGHISGVQGVSASVLMGVRFDRR
jgi:DNA-binding Lrp family transcriptional regulator